MNPAAREGCGFFVSGRRFHRLPKPGFAGKFAGINFQSHLNVLSKTAVIFLTAACARADVAYETEIEPLLVDYCFDCHGDGSREGDFRMDTFTDLAEHLDDTRHWIPVWRNLRSQLMPPSDEAQPSTEEKRKILSWIESTVFKLDPEDPDPGRVTIRRLNRNEYRYAILDLLGVDYDTTEIFPPDDTGYGFDNIGDVLSISPLLMEKYITAAEEVVNLALPDDASAQVPKEDFPAENFKQREYSKGHRMILVDGPPPEDDPAASDRYARKIMRSFVSRAFRRPVVESDIDRLVAIVKETDRQPGKSFQDGIKMAIATCLASPRFLFRVEIQPEPNNPERIVPLDEYALASRLSFFLWSSVPDDELLSLAFNKRLRANLRQQVGRMIADPRSHRLTKNFTGQWLQARDIATVPLSAPTIPGVGDNREAAEIFDPRLRTDMREETYALFDFILRNGRPVEELISARYSFLNERLADYYGIDGVKGEKLRPVDLTEHPERGGLLTQGTFLIVTSNPTRTSPVKRGLFVLDNLLGTPPPPAPPNVPELEEAGKAEENSKPTMRQMMEIHRKDPDCRGCHARMDPIGLGLENFDALGRFRQTENGKPIDTEGKLVTGEEFSDVSALKEILAVGRKRDFYRTISEKLLTYAIGRGVEYYDSVTIAQLVDHLETHDGKLVELIHAITTSAPFQKRRGDS